MIIWKQWQQLPQRTSGDVTLIPMVGRFANLMSALPEVILTLIVLSSLDCGEMWRYVWWMDEEKEISLSV